MTKSDLINLVAEKMPSNRRHDAELIVNTVFNRMTEALASGDRIEIRGFGSFHVRNRKPREGRNPKSGRKVLVESKKVPFFKAGKELKKLVDGVRKKVGA